MFIVFGSQREIPPTGIKTLTLIGRLTCHSSESPHSSVSLVSFCLAIILLVNIVVAPPEQEELVLADCQVNIQHRMLVITKGN